MEEQFPRFQYSYFPHGKDGEQLVIRGSDFNQFVLDVESIKTQFTTTQPTSQIVTPAVIVATTPAGSPTPVNPKRVCVACGSEMDYKEGTSKAGNAYKGFFCKAKCGSDPVWIKD